MKQIQTKFQKNSYIFFDLIRQDIKEMINFRDKLMQQENLNSNKIINVVSAGVSTLCIDFYTDTMKKFFKKSFN